MSKRQSPNNNTDPNAEGKAIVEAIGLPSPSSEEAPSSSYCKADRFPHLLSRSASKAMTRDNPRPGENCSPNSSRSSSPSSRKAMLPVKSRIPGQKVLFMIALIAIAEYGLLYKVISSEAVHEMVSSEARYIRAVASKLKPGQNGRKHHARKLETNRVDLQSVAPVLLEAGAESGYDEQKQRPKPAGNVEYSTVSALHTGTSASKVDIAASTVYQTIRNMTSEATLGLPQSNRKSPLPLIVTEANRSIVLVHVGKAGGMTLRRNIAWECDKSQASYLMRRCQKHQEDNLKLSYQTNHLIHMWDYNETKIQEATSFVVTLRNPVARVISAYRYAHPKNCQRRSNPKAPRTGGCVMIEMGLVSQPRFMEYVFYRDCFPEAGVEDFAQSVLPTWKPNAAFAKFRERKTRECRRMARRVAQGHPHAHVSNHMQFNYQYYAEKTVFKYPEKEVFGVRTEHENDDMKALDLLIGGSAKFDSIEKYSHGSEIYMPSPISIEAYHKLCCVLSDEIEVYLHILNRASNLDQAAKQQSEDSLREKCGVQTSWSTWKDGICQPRLHEAEEQTVWPPLGQ